jgi:hypothetical protein
MAKLPKGGMIDLSTRKSGAVVPSTGTPSIGTPRPQDHAWMSTSDIDHCNPPFPKGKPRNNRKE